MRRRMHVVVSILMGLLLWQSTVLAFPNEPGGFKGMRWGQSVETVKEIKGKYAVQYYLRVKNADQYFIYLEGGDRYSAGESIELFAYFWDNKLYQTVAYVYEDHKGDIAARYEKLRQIAIHNYGSPSNEVRHSDTRFETNWLGEKTQLILNHFSDPKNLKNSSIQIIFRDPTLFNAMQNDVGKFDSM